jgi:AAA+ ATPase superfamily predicted ATPase
MESAFVGRHEELALLDEIWNKPQAALVVLYGRRRVGKTRLLTHWLQQEEDAGLYWMAPATSALDQLRSFSQALLDFADPEAPIPDDFTYTSWELALQQIARLAGNRRIAIFIDEVTYLMEVDPKFVGILQKAWDRWLSKSNVMLALSGSQMGLMQRKILSYQAPLYGRTSAQIKLPPMPFEATEQFFPHYTIEERIMIYAIMGGIPAYWERLDPEKSVIDNIRNQLNPKNSWMHEEPNVLLNDFISEPHNYVGIVRAIAHGANTISEISNRSGLSKGLVSKYLSVLRNTGFVERRTPVTDRSPDSRRGRYFITDPFLRFFYRFLATHQSKLALGKLEQTLNLIEEEMPEFIRENTWRELCRNWVLLASGTDALPVTVDFVGSEWKRTYSLDVVGVDFDAQTLVVGNALWMQPGEAENIQDVVRRTSAIIPQEGEWQVYYVGFSAQGWTEDAVEQAEELIASAGGRGRRKWHAIGIRLLDLEEIDRDLSKWTVLAYQNQR